MAVIGEGRLAQRVGRQQPFRSIPGLEYQHRVPKDGRFWRPVLQFVQLPSPPEMDHA